MQNWVKIIIGLALLAGVIALFFIVPWPKTWNLHAPLEFLYQAEEDWHLWIALTAFGTVGATVVALYLSFNAWRSNKAATARVVSAWITETYEPRSDGSSYKRTVKMHLANESNEPVFSAIPNVKVGNGERNLGLLSAPVPIGPLSAPVPISVIPPRRELVFDISVPLLAHTDSWDPTVSLVFKDPEGRRWLRHSDGTLENVTRKKYRWRNGLHKNENWGFGVRNARNPMFVAEQFFTELEQEDSWFEGIKPLLLENSWVADWDEEEWARLRAALSGLHYRLTPPVFYPAPRIARIMLSRDSLIDLKRPLFLILILEPSQGWRILGVGKTMSPDRINFDGSLLDEIRPYD